MNILSGNKPTLKSILIPVLLYSVMACGNNHSPEPEYQTGQTDSSSLKQPEVIENRSDDSIRKNEELIDAYKRFYETPLAKEGDFSFKTGYQPIDELKKRFDTDPGTIVKMGEYVMRGDYSHLIKSMSNQKKEVLHYRKSDSGDYGFGNGQYYFQNDSLKLMRDFSVNLESYHDELQGLTFKIEEEIYTFTSGYVEIKQREVIVPSFITFDYSFKGTPFRVKRVPVATIYEEKKKEVFSTLAMKSED